MSSAKQEPNHHMSFPKPTLITPIATTRTQAPTLLTISIAAQRTHGNAASIHSIGGDGRNGHLSLTISPVAYFVVTNGIPFLPSSQHQPILQSTHIIQLP